MKRITLIVISLALLLLGSRAEAARTVIAREMFRGATAINSTTPGAFTAAYGTITPWRVGPKLTTDTDDGRHGDVSSTVATGAYFNLVNGGDGSAFCFEYWYWTGELNGNNFASITQAGVNFGASAPWYNLEIAIFRKPDGSYLFRHPTETDAPVLESAIPRHTWVRFYIYEYYTGASFQWDYRMGYQLVGGAETDVWNRTNQVVTNINHYDVIGFANDQSGVKYSFALGGVSLTQIGGPADFGPDAGITAPVNAGKTWYVSALASSPGDGSSTLSPLTTTQLASALAGSGILGNAAGTGAGYGDHVIFMNDGVYQAPTVIVTIRQRGLWLDGNGSTLRFLKTITGTWTQPDAGAAPNVWAINNSELSPVHSYVPVLFERSPGVTTPAGNGMTPEVGANFAAVESALNTTAGSFWSDGTTMYVHPYANTNPNTDGKTYERTTSTALESGISFGGQDQKVNNFTIYGNAYYDKTNLQNVNGTAITDDGGSGRSGGVVDGINATLWGKHGINFTTSTNVGVTISNSTSEIGWPYGSGAQTMIDNFSTSGSQTAKWTNVNARITRNAWAVGPSSAGLTQSNATDWIYAGHDAGGLTNEFSNVSFTNCHFAGGAVTPFSGVIQSVTFNGCDGFNLSGYTGTVTISNNTATTPSSTHSWLGF